MVFMGRGFTSGEQESGSVFSEAVCKTQASECYVLPLVLKTFTLPLDHVLALRK